MTWFRWYAGTATDPKFMVVARLAGQNVAAVVAVWAMLLERASDVSERDETQCNAGKRGFVSGFDCEAADAVLGLEDGASEAIMRAMEKKGLLTGGKVTNWEKRQPKREDSSTERVRRFREKKKYETQCNAGKREETPEESRVDNININSKAESINELSSNTFSASGDAVEAQVVLKGKKKVLRGKRAETFERFWEAFAYKKDKAQAIDAWAAIPVLTDALVDTICRAAAKEAGRRPELKAEGRTPIYAQGWLNGRRWEDEDETAESEWGFRLV